METSPKTLNLLVTESLLVTDSFSVFSARNLDEGGRAAKVRSAVSVMPGDTVTCLGRWHKHPKYGWQFQANQVRHVIPENAEGVQGYLGSGRIPGIGKTLAGYLVKRFGANVLSVIEDTPLLLTEVPGIGEEKAHRISADVRRQRAHLHQKNTLVEFGLPEHVIHSLDARYGDETMKLLRANPYQVLASRPYFDFELARAVARSLNWVDDHYCAVVGAVECALHQLDHETGSNVHPYDDVFGRVCALVEDSDNPTRSSPSFRLYLASVVKQSDKFRLLPNEADNLDDQYIATSTGVAHAETIAKAVRERSSMTSGYSTQIEKAQSDLYNPFPVSLTRILNAPLTVINVDSADRGLSDFYSLMATLHTETDLRVMVGEVSRARADRLATSVRLPVKPLQSLLLQNAQSQVRHPFRNVDVLIVPDAHALDSSRLHDLLAFTPLTTMIVLIGDNHRLPPVTGGDPFSVLMACRYISAVHVDAPSADPRIDPIGHVRQLLMQGETLDGLIPEFESLTELGLQSAKHRVASVIPSKDTDLVEFVDEALDILIDNLKTRSIQILAPTRFGDLGSHALAARTAIQVHPAKRDDSPVQIHGTGLVEGDVLICERNLKDFGLVNGDCYTVTNVASDVFTLDGVSKPVPVRLLPFFQFTHALTTHRYQVAGTPKDVVIIVLGDENTFLMTREWLYTASTYAKNRLYIIGYRQAYNECLSSSLRSTRRSVLSFYLPAKSH